MTALKPPVSRWVRLNEAAARLGLSPRVLRRSIEAGHTDVRMHRLGERGLVHLAQNDLDELAAHLSWGAPR